MEELMCENHENPNECAVELDKLDGKGVFKSMLGGGIFNRDFKKDVLAKVVENSDLPEEERKKALESLRNPVEPPKSNGTKDESLKPLSLRKSIRDSYNILRGRV
tara:strand:- start:3079 stop:3393 length:315 start_codon:yes stop_codon:yes gene_type:complete